MIAIGCDHTALDMKTEIIAFLRECGQEIEDVGTFTPESVDYPVIAEAVAMAVADGEADRGILICGTGVGMSIAANKVNGIRCACCSEPYSAEFTRRHNDANILAIGARVIDVEMAKMIVKTFLEAEYEAGRHARRVEMFAGIEARNRGMILE